MQNWYKSVFVDTAVPFQLPYMQICTALWNCSYTGFEPELLTSQVTEATEQTYRLWKPIDTRLDMCDANVQNKQFSNLTTY